MNTTTFIASLVSDLAWPVAFVVGVLVFKKPIYDLLGSISKISHGDTAIAFDREAKSVETSIAAMSLSDSGQALDTSLAHNVGRIAVAWAELEDIIRDRLVRAGEDSASKLNGKSLIGAARSLDLITTDQANSLLGLNTMRNLAVHGKESDISEKRVAEYLSLADAIKTVLQMTASKRPF